MRRFAIGVLCGIGGYLLAAVIGYALIDALSPNAHDRSVEAAMTSVFVCGPLGALIGFVVGSVLGGRRVSGSDPDASGPGA